MRMQRLIYLLIFLCIFGYQCKDKNNLTTITEQPKTFPITEDSIELKNVFTISKNLLQEKKNDSAIQSFQKLINYGIKYKNQYYQGIAHTYIAQLHQEKGDFDMAHIAYQNAINTFKNANDSLLILKTHFRYSHLYAEIGDFNSAEILLKEGSKYISQYEKEKLIEHLYNNFGYLAILQNDYDEALNWYNKVIESHQDVHSYKIAVTNLAYIFAEKGEFKKSKDLYSELLSEITLESDSSYFAYLQNAYQNLLIKENKIEIDTSKLFNSLEIRKIINNNLGVMDSYKTITDYYLVKKDTANAIQNAYNLLEISKKHKSSLYIPIAYEFLFELEKPNIVKNLSKDYVHFKDSIEFVHQNSTQEFARTVYEWEQNQNEFEVLQLDNKAQKQNLIFANIYIGIIIIGFFIILLYLINYFRIQKIKQQNYLQKQILETEKNISEKVKKEISDGIKNSIDYIKQHLSDPDMGTKENLIHNLEKVYQQSRSISRENSFFQSHEEFAKEIEALMSRYSDENYQITILPYSTKIWKKISLTKRIELYNALNELQDILKKDSKATQIKWDFKVLNKSLLIKYEDDGYGFDSELPVNLQGLTKIHTRMQKINGEFKLTPKNEAGITIELKAPLR